VSQSLAVGQLVHPLVQVSDCVFKDNRARGALLKSSNVLATRNVFDHTTGPAIKTETDGASTWALFCPLHTFTMRTSFFSFLPLPGCYWFEGHPVVNWTVVNNSFIGCNYATAAEPGDVYIDHAVPIFDVRGWL
jgi:hypothetical protein